MNALQMNFNNSSIHNATCNSDLAKLQRDLEENNLNHLALLANHDKEMKLVSGIKNILDYKNGQQTKKKKLFSITKIMHKLQ
jgi:hypothetical protein